jgi:hypothetical protein
VVFLRFGEYFKSRERCSQEFFFFFSSFLLFFFFFGELARAGAGKGDIFEKGGERDGFVAITGFSAVL